MSKKDEITVLARLSPDMNSLVISHADKLGRLFRPLKDDDLEVTVKKFYRQRSAAQNRWMWGVCIPSIQAWMKESGMAVPSKEGLYAYLRTAIVGHEMVIENIGGIDIPVLHGKRFSQMNTVEFSGAVEKIILFYAELGFQLPLPERENLTENFIK